MTRARDGKPCGFRVLDGLIGTSIFFGRTPGLTPSSTGHRGGTRTADASMSADPNALLAFKQSNLKERVSARSSARVHRLGPIRRASGANSASLFPPTFIRSFSDLLTPRPAAP